MAKNKSRNSNRIGSRNKNKEVKVAEKEKKVSIEFHAMNQELLPKGITVDTKIWIHEEEYRNVLYYGDRVGIIHHYKSGDVLISGFKEDKENKNTDILEKLIKCGFLKAKSVTFHSEKEGLYNGTVYHIMYKNIEHSSLKPTPDGNVSFCANVSHDLYYELLFTDSDFDEYGRLYMTFKYSTKGSHAMSFFSEVQDLEDKIEELIENRACGFRNDGSGGTEILFYDEFGQPYEVEVHNAYHFMQKLSSARIIECTSEIMKECAW